MPPKSLPRLPPQFTGEPPDYSENDPALDDVVNVQNCFHYLAFLEAFWARFDSFTEAEQKVYLVRAEYRYSQFVFVYDSMPDASSFVPPIDVAMMWHAHLLSPARFYEDVVLRFKTKELIDASFPLAGCVRRQPDPATIAAWELYFPDEPFDLNKDTLYGKGTENEEDGGYLLQCQENGCTHSEIISWSDYTKLRLSLNAPKREHTCVNGLKIALNANYMVTKNLCRDLHDCMARNPSALAGVLLTTTGVRRITPFWPQGLEIFYSNVMRDGEVIHDYSLEAYAKEQLIAEWQKSSDPAAEPRVIELLTAIRTCYQGNPTRFSMDLIHGVCRQRPFYNLVASGNWRPLVRLRRVIRRYHDFLYTMRKGFTYQVPTLEMDVGWHTHMLYAGRYRMFTLSYLGNVPNHDDAVDPADMTRIAATMNYNILYTRLWEEFNLDNNMTTDDNGFKITSMIDKPNTIDMRPGQFHWGSIQCSFENINSFSKYYTEEMLPSIVRPFNMLICHNCVPAAYYDEDNIMPWALRVWILERESILRTSMKHSTYGYIGTCHASSAAALTQKQIFVAPPGGDGLQDMVLSNLDLFKQDVFCVLTEKAETNPFRRQRRPLVTPSLTKVLRYHHPELIMQNGPRQVKFLVKSKVMIPPQIKDYYDPAMVNIVFTNDNEYMREVQYNARVEYKMHIAKEGQRRTKAQRELDRDSMRPDFFMSR